MSTKEDNRRDFKLFRSFDIDNGELDGQSPQQCFVLGYELAQVDYLLSKETDPFHRPVHAANRDRIEKACVDSGRDFSLTWMDDDQSETWCELIVSGKSY